MTPKLQRLHDALRNSFGGRIVSLKEALGVWMQTPLSLWK